MATDLVATATDYTHDPLGRLTSSTTGDYTVTYAWDASSNLVAETVSDDLGTNLAGDGHAVTRVVDGANQTTSVVTDFGRWPVVQTTTVALAYDRRGNRTGETTTRTTGGRGHASTVVLPPRVAEAFRADGRSAGGIAHARPGFPRRTTRS